jgi:predicted peroxiredoxin
MSRKSRKRAREMVPASVSSSVPAVARSTDRPGEREKAFTPPTDVLKGTVQVVGDGSAGAPIFLNFLKTADEIAAWWSAQRDRELRDFWRKESLLASAIYTVVSRQAAFSWTLDGPPKAVARVHDILTYADLGLGWVGFVEKITEELETQDNGAFIEIIRPKGAGPEVAPIGIAHLDSGACMRTGNPENPVLYLDRKGNAHLLKWWQVAAIAEMPSPIQTMNGVGFCAVSRVLMAAQILRDIAIYKREKVSGQAQRSIWLVQGISNAVIRDGLKEAAEEEVTKGFRRFVTAKVIAAMDSTVEVRATELNFASLPDNYEEETTLRWYIAQLAMGFGTDYQEFAPMPGQKLGSGAQAEVQAQKARGKGPALFQKILEFVINMYLCPESVTFKIVETDPGEELQKAMVAKTRAEERSIRILSGEIDTEQARQLALDAGDLPAEMVAKDVTPETRAEDTEAPPKEEKRPETAGAQDGQGQGADGGGDLEASAKGFFRRYQERRGITTKGGASPRQDYRQVHEGRRGVPGVDPKRGS